jgi:hypothetical protein
MSPDERKRSLLEFVQWVAEHIRGDEKGEAQVFLDRLFQAFGHPGAKEVGAEFEKRVRKADAAVSFADLVWKPVVLIEMKKRGTNLARHYRQAFDYWTYLVPNRPRYVILCNFDEFWIYDFETQMDAPVDTVAIKDLPKRYGPLLFLFSSQETPIFGNDQVAVTREAADYLATCFNMLVRGNRNPKIDWSFAQRFVLQMLVALFAEDIGLLEKYFVTTLLNECKRRADSYDLLGGLFEAMNTPSGARGGRYKGVEYFNGGLFAEPARVELFPEELNQLRKAAKADWSKVRPEIFGTLFEHSIDQDKRHAFGQQFTNPVDIMKIVGPTIVAPWRELIENAKTLQRLQELHHRLDHFTVLDPACGSGNFLYIAYREIKRLEAVILERMKEFPSKSSGQAQLSFVTAQNFYGIDIEPLAVELAKVTMMIARKLAIDELHVAENALPLDNLDANFRVADALIDDHGHPAEWPRADVIIGNPPFLGAKRLKPERGVDYVNAVRRAYPEVPGMADYCVYWFRKAHDQLPECTAKDPVAGRAGLVGTQNVRNNQSRVGGLDYIVQTGTIVEAVDNQPWSGEANVHVSIVDWAKTQKASLLPPKRKLWFQSDARRPDGNRRKRGAGPADKTYNLGSRMVDVINSALSDQMDVSSKRLLACNREPKKCFQGKVLGYDGFLLNALDVRKLGGASEIIVPIATGRELLGNFSVKRWVIDFKKMDMLAAAAHEKAFEYCRRHVLPEVRKTATIASASASDMAKARAEHLERWWQFWNRRDQLNECLRKLSRYIACSRVTRRPVMVFVSTDICPSDALQVFAFDDDYAFGVLQSHAHFEWFKKSSRLKIESDIRYSSRDVFETFPWPQAPPAKQVNNVAVAGREVRRIRDEALAKVGGGLRAVYRTLELPGKNSLKDAHADLDAAVLAAYGFSPKKDLLAQLFDLNQAVARRIEHGEAVTAPGVPSGYPDPTRLVSDDCIRADEPSEAAAE